MKNFKKLPKKFYNLFEVLQMVMIMWFLRTGIRLRGAFETNLTINYEIHELYYCGLVNKTGLIFKDLKDVEWKTNTS